MVYDAVFTPIRTSPPYTDVGNILKAMLVSFCEPSIVRYPNIFTWAPRYSLSAFTTYGRKDRVQLPVRWH